MSVQSKTIPVLLALLLAYCTPAAIIASDTATLYQTYLESADDTKAFKALYDAWSRDFKAGLSQPDWDKAVADALTPAQLVATVANLIPQGYVTSFQEYCLRLLRQADLSGALLRRALAVSHWYEGTRLARSLMAHAGDSDAGMDHAAAWSAVAESLTFAYDLFPSEELAGLLGQALRESGQQAEAWRFDLFYLYNESASQVFGPIGLWLRRLYTPGLESWSRERERARERVLRSALVYSLSDEQVPYFGADIVADEDGRPVVLSFTDRNSPLYARKAVFAFFKTTCTYCETELRALDAYYRSSLGKLADGMVILGVGQKSGLPAAALPAEIMATVDDLSVYRDRLNLALPLVMLNDEQLLRAYDVQFVPLLQFFEADGKPLCRVSFASMKNAKNKLSWLLEAFRAQRLASLVEQTVDSPLPGFADAVSPADFAAETIAAGESALSGAIARIRLYFDPACSACDTLISKTIPDIARAKGVRVEIQKFDILDPDNFSRMSRELGERGEVFSATPLAFLDGHVFQGFSAIESGLQSVLVTGDPGAATASSGTAITAAQAVPALTLIPVFLAGLADGVNPCAFSTLLFLISVLSLGGRSRRQLIVIGLVYVFVVFASYLAIGLGLLAGVRALSAFPQLARLIKGLTSLALLAFAVLSARDAIMDYRGKKDKLVLKLSPAVRGRIHKAIRVGTRMRWVVLGTVLMAFLVSVFELACTGQVYFPIIAWLVNSGALWRGLGFLVVYNLGFILPLVAVFVLAVLGVTLKKLSVWFSSHVWLAKAVLSGVFLVFLILNLVL